MTVFTNQVTYRKLTKTGLLRYQKKRIKNRSARMPMRTYNPGKDLKCLP